MSCSMQNKYILLLEYLLFVVSSFEILLLLLSYF